MQYPKNTKILAVVLFLVSGTISTFAYKLQGTRTVTEGSHEKHFFHPYMQTMTMFIGESLCLLIYYFTDQKPLPLEVNKKPHKPWVFFIPACADSCSSILQYMGLSFIAGSTYMMFKGAAIVTTAIFSKLLIRMALKRQHFVGCGMAILGITIVGSSGYLQSDEKGQSTFVPFLFTQDKQFVGYLLMVISLVFNGFLYAYEQYLLKKHTINPLQMVGFEGLFGVMNLLVITLILSFIPCSFGEGTCVYDGADEPYIELPLVFVSELFAQPQLLIMVVLGMLGIGVYNLNGVRITKMFDALTRALLNISKTSVIWLVGIVITLIAEGSGEEELKLESLNVAVNAVKLVGFSIIIAGTLIYNRLILKGCFPTAEESAQNDEFKRNFTSMSSDNSIADDLLLNRKDSNKIQL